MKKKYLVRNIGIAGLLMLSAAGCQSEQAATNTVPETDTEISAVEDSSSAEAASTEDMQSQEETNYLYGTVNLPYADFYYGELNDIEPETDASAGQYTTPDLAAAAGYEEEGMYDAVTSATKQKSTRFEASYYEEVDTGVNILGVANVNVAITKDLYDDVQSAVEAGTPCENPLIEIVSAMTLTENVPVEYKVINSDGTLSRTIGNTITADSVTAALTSISSWGNYQIDLEGLELESSVVQGAILETSDGARYGLEHEDNLWLQPSELSVAVEPFREPHGNDVAYQRFTDLPGKTITKITYLVANGDDIAIDTNLYCNMLLSDEYGISGDESVTYSTEGTDISVTLTVPSDSSYQLTAALSGRTAKDISELTYDNGTLSIPASFTPGSYTFHFEDAVYEGLTYTVLVDSGLNESDVTFDGTTIQLAGELGLSGTDYIANISAAAVNGEKLNGRNLGSVLFNEDGSINPDAETGSDDAKTPLFAEGSSYEVTLESAGYPSVTFTLER
ncbi:MAG: hypothetical protein J6D08_08070 [Lachnospiraceae bacterium]|nr:hypothetical protein [Lachnospiraceae bacterium]